MADKLDAVVINGDGGGEDGFDDPNKTPPVPASSPTETVTQESLEERQQSSARFAIEPQVEEQVEREARAPTSEHSDSTGRPPDNIRQISVQADSCVIETRPDSIVIHGAGDVQRKENILGALVKHLANQLADTGQSNLELRPIEVRTEDQKGETQPLVAAQTGFKPRKAKATGAGPSKDIPDAGYDNCEHVGLTQTQSNVQADANITTNFEVGQPEEDTQDQQKETQPLVAAQTGNKSRKTKATGTGLSLNMPGPDTDLHYRLVHRLSIPVQVGITVVGFIAMLLPIFELSVLFSYLFDNDVFNQVGRIFTKELPNLK